MTNPLTYPLFVKSNDDKSISVISSRHICEWLYYERIDIDCGNYSCWDCRGVRFHMVWNDAGMPASVVEEETPHPEELRMALQEYAKLYGVETLPSQSDFLQMFECIQHQLRCSGFLHRLFFKTRLTLVRALSHLFGK